MLKYLIAMAVGVGVVFAFSGPKQSTAPVKTVENTAYSDCLFDETTKAVAEMLRAKYDNLTSMQVRAILCKDKK